MVPYATIVNESVSPFQGWLISLGYSPWASPRAEVFRPFRPYILLIADNKKYDSLLHFNTIIKLNSVKSRISAYVFKKCGKQEKTKFYTFS